VGVLGVLRFGDLLSGLHFRFGLGSACGSFGSGYPGYAEQYYVIGSCRGPWVTFGVLFRGPLGLGPLTSGLGYCDYRRESLGSAAHGDSEVI
jgi:hypothetical protein